MKEEGKHKEKEPIGTYAPKQEKKEKPEKKSGKKQFGTVIRIKSNVLIVNSGGNGVSIKKTAKHKDVQVGDKIEV